MHYYQFHIGDFRSATLHLSNAEELAYRRLLDWYYDTETSIPLDTQWVSRRLRVGIEELLSVLNDFFTETPEGWINSRCESEIDGYRGLVSKNRENGKKGGRPSKKKNPVGYQSVPSGNPDESQKKPNHEPVTNNHEPQIKNTLAAERRNWVSELIGMGVDERHAKDWLEVRKAKRAKMTETALKAMQREAGKAGISLAEAVKIAAENSWQSFKAEWLANRGMANGRTQETRPLSAVDRVKAGAAERERNRQGAQPEYLGGGDFIEGEFTSGPQADGPPLDSYGRDLWAQVD